MRKPIGIFDSGFGGLTVTKQILDLLPNEDVVYFGDTAHLPYGNKSKNVITNFSRNIIEFLKKQNVKMVVIACNTASAYSLNVLKKEFDIPIIGVIEPGARRAVLITRNNRIGIIGTEATVSSRTYERAINKIDRRANVFSQACPLLVPLVEEGWMNHSITRQVAELYLGSLIKEGIDSLILGCTHYPLIKPLIGDIMGNTVTLIDSSVEVARSVKDVLQAEDMLNSPKEVKKGKRGVEFFVSDNPRKFSKLGSMFLYLPDGSQVNEIKNVKYVDMDK